MQSQRYARDQVYSTHILRHLTLADPVPRNFDYCPPMSKLRAASPRHSDVSITAFSIMSNNLLREHVPKDANHSRSGWRRRATSSAKLEPYVFGTAHTSSETGAQLTCIRWMTSSSTMPVCRS